MSPMTRVQLELENRYSLLLTHGLIGWAGGLLILFFGFGAVLAPVTGARPVLGLVGLLGGALLHAATVLRRTTVQLAGMGLLGAWYVALFAAYVGVMVTSPAPVWSWPWDPSANGAPPYPVVIFGGLVLFAGRQAMTLRRITKLEG